MIYKNKFKFCILNSCRFLIIFYFLFSTRAFADDTQNPKWTVGAHKFSYTQDVKRSQFENAVLSAMPELILEQLYGTKSRNIPNDEVLNRNIDKLVKERLSLFLELSSEVKKKDSLVLKHLSEYQYNKQMGIQEKKIAEIKEKIDLNLEKQDAVFEDYRKEQGDFAAKNRLTEEFAFYKGESSELFSFSSAITEPDFKSYNCSEEIVKAGINSLITGTIVTYGEYAAVSVEMFLYPGAVSTGVITEVGLLSLPDEIAKNIAYRLAPIIENALPCEVQVKIYPEELRSKAKLTVDSTLYTKIPDKIILSTGVHNLSFECEGYKRENFSYGFGYEKKYLIELEFLLEDYINTALLLKKPFETDIFYNGIKSPDSQMNIKINNTGILGYAYSINRNTVFFKIDDKDIFDNAVFMADIKDYNIEDQIEKSRRLMYISYSALICSLPFLFYSYSNYTNYYKAYELGSASTSLDDINKYKNMTYVSGAISAACGIWFTVQLVIYLVNANKTLPVEAKSVKIDYNEALSSHKESQEEFKQKREELEKLKEAEKEAQEQEEQGTTEE